MLLGASAEAYSCFVFIFLVSDTYYVPSTELDALKTKKVMVPVLPC